MTDKDEKTFLPVPPLRSDDTYGKPSREGGGTIEFRTVTVIMHGGKKFNLSHDSGRVFTMFPHQFVDLPESLAMEIKDMPNIEIISKADAQRFIDKARDKVLEVNKDVIEYNHKVKAGETKFIEGVGRVKMHKKKPRLVQNNRPYDHYVRAKQEWASKRKGKKKKRTVKKKEAKK